MKLSQTIRYALYALVLTLFACDEVDEGKRYIFVPPVDVQRNIVIEDFTGQRCVNCPTATVEIEKLQQEYGEEHVIAVSIHSGPFGHRTTMTSPRLSLCTETGDRYYQYWGIEAQPGVLINRNGNPVYDPAQYGIAVREALSKPTSLQLNVGTTLSEDGTTLAVEIEALTGEAMDGKLQVWLLEDNIVDIQLMPDGTTNRAYQHNHVLRMSLTHDYLGDSFPVSNKEAQTLNYTANIDGQWNSNNLSVVAFYFTEQEGVVQAVRRRVVK